MSPVALRAAGLVLTFVYAAAIVRVYVRQPTTIPEVTGSLTSSIGAYRIDQARFDAGLGFFRSDQFVEARDAFGQADPARQDARVQFYVAYSFLRQGWGRVYADDALYKAGLEALEHARTLTPGGAIQVDDPDLKLQTAEQVKAELERGLTRELSDFNPARVFRERP